jgi:hypothetical protein
MRRAPVGISEVRPVAGTPSKVKMDKMRAYFCSPTTAVSVKEFGIVMVCD